MGTCGLRIVTEKRIREFVEREPRPADAMWRWVDSVESSDWRNPSGMKAMYASASFVGDLTVFNVGGNNYRADVSRLEIEKTELLVPSSPSTGGRSLQKPRFRNPVRKAVHQ